MERKSKNNRGKAARLLLLCLLTCLLPCSCSQRTEPYFPDTQESFSAELSGRFLSAELDFCASLSVCTAEEFRESAFFAEWREELAAAINNATRVLFLRYSEPPLLAGTHLCIGLVDGSLSETAFLAEAGVGKSLPAASLSGLLSPARAMVEKSTPLRVEKEKDRYLLELENASMVLNFDKRPLSFHSKALELRVIWWESGTARLPKNTLDTRNFADFA